MAARYRPSLAKNTISRSLRGIIDPHPTDAELDRLWEHFESRCAYCSVKVGVVPKDNQIDHLNAGGTNHVSNRVLSCSNCNEKEKRELPWRDFLQKKAKSTEEYGKREVRINLWVELNWVAGHRVSDDVLLQVEAEISGVIRRFDEALSRIRALRDSQ